jgi:hypothetical protein
MTTLVLELAPRPLLQHKLRLLIQALQPSRTADKAFSLVSTSYSVFQLDTNISLVFKKKQRHQLHKSIKIPPFCRTRQRDEIMLPHEGTFLSEYEVLSLKLLLSNMKETTFQTLNRMIYKLANIGTVNATAWHFGHESLDKTNLFTVMFKKSICKAF